MARIKQRQVLPGVDKALSNATKVYVAEACAANDILVATGTKNGFLSVVKADANDLTKCRGPFFVADYAAALGDYVAVALPWKLVTGVNTNGYSVGDAVYLSAATAGAVLFDPAIACAPTAKDALFSAIVRVGRVVTAHGSGGAYLLEPGIADGAPLTGKVTTGGTATTVTFGGTATSVKLIGCPVVVTPEGATADHATQVTAIMESDAGAGAHLDMKHDDMASAVDVVSYTIFC